MGVNTSPINGTQITNSSQGPLIFTNSLFNGSSDSTTHKSFDFSNINIDKPNYGYLKQFHQTRIYIQDFDGITTNGQKVGGKNSTCIISSNLPESFNYAIGSEWGNPLSDIFKGVGNLVLQLASSAAPDSIGQHFRSGINRAANFLIWNGAKPLEIQLKIPVIDDDYCQRQCGDGKVRTDLKQALEFLSCLALPSKSGELGFYKPAASPLDIHLKVLGHSFNLAPNKARIMVQVGGMLFIDNCIIKSISVNYPNTKSLMYREYNNTLTPILAEVTINITTIETLTSSTYTKMLWLNQQEDQGKGNFDIDDAAKKLMNGAVGLAKKVVNYTWDHIKDGAGQYMNQGNEILGGSSNPEANQMTGTNNIIENAATLSKAIGNRLK